MLMRIFLDGFTLNGSPRITDPSYDYFPTTGLSTAFVTLLTISTGEPRHRPTYRARLINGAISSQRCIC